jgi:hypothetical protein
MCGVARPWHRCRVSLAISWRRASVRAALNRAQARLDTACNCKLPTIAIVKKQKTIAFRQQITLFV